MKIQNRLDCLFILIDEEIRKCTSSSLYCESYEISINIMWRNLYTNVGLIIYEESKNLIDEKGKIR